MVLQKQTELWRILTHLDIHWPLYLYSEKMHIICFN